MMILDVVFNYSLKVFLALIFLISGLKFIKKLMGSLLKRFEEIYVQDLNEK
jgi:hypothetical protein